MTLQELEQEMDNVFTKVQAVDLAKRFAASQVERMGLGRYPGKYKEYFRFWEIASNTIGEKKQAILKELSEEA